MSQIGSAIHEIHHMDRIASRDQWVNRIHPLVKLLLTVFYIALVVSFSKYDVIGLLGMGVYPLVLFHLAEVSFRDCLWRLRVILPLVCVVGIANPFFDRIPIAAIGGVVITTGWLSMVTLMLKGIFSVLASYLLIATTTIEKLCYALRCLHVPSILVTQILLAYRYVTVLLEEANRITQAYSLRAPKQKGVHFKVWGSLTGQLLMRSIDRANEVYDSMTVRGFQGEFPYIREQSRFRRQDVIYAAFWCGLFLLLRRIPVIWVVGTLF